MNGLQIKTWFLFWCSLVLSGLLVWFGIKLMAWDSTFSKEANFLLAGACMIGGVLSLSGSTGENSSGLASFGAMLATGLYFLARANGRLNHDWLSSIAGMAAFAAAILLVYIAFPHRTTAA